MSEPRSEKPVTLPRAVEQTHELLAWLIPRLDDFPRARRFTLGDRLETGLLAVLEDLVDAAYRRDKGVALDHANRRLAVVRHLWRLAFELKLINLRRYEYASRMLDDLGRQIGGWKRSRSS